MITIAGVPVKTRVPSTAWVIAGMLMLVSLASTLMHTWHVGRSAGGGKQSSGEHELGDGASRLATFAAAALTACRCCLLCARQDCAASKKDGDRSRRPVAATNSLQPLAYAAFL